MESYLTHLSKMALHAALRHGHWIMEVSIWIAEDLSEAPHRVVHPRSWKVKILEPAVFAGAWIIAWQHPAGPFWTNKFVEVCWGESSNVSESEVSVEEELVDDDELSQREVVSIALDPSKNISNSSSIGISKGFDNGESSIKIGGSGIGVWPPRCNGRTARQPLRTADATWDCTHKASIVSSREYNCTDPPVWFPCSLREDSGNRSWAAADKKVTFREWSVSWCACSADKVGLPHGVCAAHLSAFNAAAYGNGAFPVGEW